MPLVPTREYNQAKEVVDAITSQDIDSWCFESFGYITGFCNAWFKDNQRGCKPEKSFVVPKFLDYADFSETYEKSMKKLQNFLCSLVGSETITDETFPKLLSDELITIFKEIRSSWDKEELKLKNSNAEVSFYASFKHMRIGWPDFRSMYFSFILAVLRTAYTKKEYQKGFIYNQNSYPNKLKIYFTEPEPPKVELDKIKLMFTNDVVQKEILKLFDTSFEDLKEKSSGDKNDLDEDHQLIKNGYNKFLKAIKKGILSKKEGEDDLKLIEQQQEFMCDNLSTTEKSATTYFTYVDTINKEIKTWIDKAPEKPSSQLLSETESDSDSPIEIGSKPSSLDNGKDGTDQFLVKLPYSSAPKVKSSIQLKKGVTPPKWSPGKVSLWEHLKSVMEYCLSLGIVQYSEKLKTCFYIFKDERDRNEFNKKFLQNLKDDMNEVQFTKEVHRMIKLFDRQNSVDPESYREKLDSYEALQKPQERIRSYMNRLEEYYMISYPDSYMAKTLQKALCKKFFQGLLDRGLAQELACTKEGYDAIYESGDKHKTLTLVEDLAFRTSSVFRSEEVLADKLKDGCRL